MSHATAAPVPVPGRTLVITAVAAERAAIERACRSGEGHACHDVTVVAAGVGPAAAAAGTARLLALSELAGQPYRTVISAGIAGGFADRIGVCDVVIATASVAADLGSQDGADFLSVERLGFGPATLAASPDLVSWLRHRLPAAATGDVLTVATATGSAARAAWLRARHPEALAEAMEGFGVATAAQGAGAAFAELRVVSNPIGPRDLAAWRLRDALGVLGSTFATLLEAPAGPGGTKPQGGCQ